MRRFAAMVMGVTLVVAGSAPAQDQQPTLHQALADARAEQAAAEARTQRLEQAAAAARGTAERLRAEQAVAAEAIGAAEARISAADAEYRLAAAHVAAHRQRLLQEQRPVSALLAGLALMADRPPLLALAGGASSDDLVRMGILLDATWPEIKARTSALSARLAEGERLQSMAFSARGELVRSRQTLAERRSEFAALEQLALQQLLATGGEALSAGDVALAAAEQVERLRAEQSDRTTAARIAGILAAEQPAPARPVAPAGGHPPTPPAYILPVQAAVVEGLGAVSESGVRSRGITLATGRGSNVSAPADGLVRFSGPFRDYDGILIIDHGGGWISMLVNLASPLKVGERVGLGDVIGRTIGPLQVQLSHRGRRWSPALIAGSSQTLSKKGKSG